MWSIISAFIFASSVCHAAEQIYHQLNLDTHNYYVLHHDPTYASLADVAEFLGLEIVEPAGGLDDTWLTRTVARRAGNNPEDDPVINAYRKTWDRALLTRREENLSLALKHLSREIPRKRTRRTPPSRRPSPQTVNGPRRAIAKRLSVSDPLFSKQWSLQNNADARNSLNVVRVWEKGITGKGVIVAVIDDGILYDHKDIKDNFAKDYSFDFVGNDKVPSEPDSRDEHGTATAGIIAAAKNDICGVGVAYDAKVASLRVTGAEVEGVLDIHEMRAFLHDIETQAISIYAVAYGIAGSGETDGPADNTQGAMLMGINSGRGGKGNIYVYAAGNGGDEGDECNYDGYVNSIYTIAIGAVDHEGKYLDYSTPCSAVMAATYSDSGDDEHNIISLGTDSLDHCTEDFDGTSAAAPAAAGIFALALQANKELTWRDMQYLCVETARRVDDDVPWDRLASGRFYSNQVGFGVLDAHTFVEAATRWKTVNQQVWMSPVPFVQFEGGTMTKDQRFNGGAKITSKGVSHTVVITEKMAKDNNFDKIEHVQVKVWIRHSRMADVQVKLTSPKGIISNLGEIRPYTRDTSLPGWTFMSLKHWGEEPAGRWRLTVNDQGNESGTGEVIGFTMTFWGCARENKPERKLYMLHVDGNVFPPSERKLLSNSSN